MSDEIKTPEGDQSGQAAEGLTNLKAEMDRKLTNVTEQLQKTNDMNAQLLEQMKAQQQAASKPAPSPEATNIGDMMFEDGNKAAALIQKQATDAAVATIRTETAAKEQAQARQNEVIGRLLTDYPELSNSNHDLYKKTVERYNAMSDLDKQSPVAYESAALRAALELGVKPYSQRDESEVSEGFTLGSNASGANNTKAELEADSNMYKIAEALGVDVSSDEAKAKLKARQRKNWLKYN